MKKNGVPALISKESLGGHISLVIETGVSRTPDSANGSCVSSCPPTALPTRLLRLYKGGSRTLGVSTEKRVDRSPT